MVAVRKERLSKDNVSSKIRGVHLFFALLMTLGS